MTTHNNLSKERLLAADSKPIQDVSGVGTTGGVPPADQSKTSKSKAERERFLLAHGFTPMKNVSGIGIVGGIPQRSRKPNEEEGHD